MDAANLGNATMADLPDASMMDGAMDDLFGEAPVGLDGGIAMPAAPLPASLILRIAEMQSRGCCTKLAWSNTGSIAQISPDGNQITFRTMIRDKKNGAWTISDDSKYPFKAPEGRKFVHIQFSGIGIDLVVVDDAGHVHLPSMIGAIGKMSTTQGELARDDSKHELNAIVGLHWLALFPAEFRGPYIDAAHKNGDRWDATMKQRDQHGLRAHHPAEGRHAFLHISRSTELTLCYQNEGQGWQSTSVMLDTLRTSDGLVTHAALGEDNSDLLAVTYDSASRLRLYRVSIVWNASQQSRGPGINFLRVEPTLDVHHLTAVNNVRPQQIDAAKLTHLQIIPQVAEAAQQVPTLPNILAIFTHAAFPPHASPDQNSTSVIARWSVETFAPTLHESFTKLKPGSNTNQVLNQITVLKRQPDVSTNGKVILTFESQMFDTILAFANSDGSLDLRDRITMEPLGPFGSTDTVSNLHQSGFDHVPGEHNLHVAMSGDGSGLVYVRVDKKIDAQCMKLTRGWHVVDDGISDDRPYIEAAAVCIARQFAFLCYNNMANDETLALLPPDASPELRSLVVRMIFRMLNRSPDISMQESSRQQMIVLKEPLVPRCLSAQLALGTNPMTGERNFAAQYAFTILNLRLAGTALASTCGRSDVKQISPEAVHFARGLVRWCMDLIVYIVKAIVLIQRDVKAGSSAKGVIDKLTSTTGSPALHLLLCSFSRALVRFQTIWVVKYFQCLQHVVPRTRSVTERQEMEAVFSLAGQLPFKLQQFEGMMAEFDQAVRQAYTKSNLSADWRGELEINMMVDGTIPDELMPAVNSLLETTIPKLTENMDLGKLHFYDTSFLQLWTSKRQNHGRIIDVLRKVQVPPGAALRTCRRCGSELEDIPPEKLRQEPYAGWFQHAQRHCVCMNYWLVA
ncbi:Mediator of RNA polymerase II transcription subunit 16 [Pseudocercospora fuligena]|uniref:Mediator of RNA polymerase II transcription subunit 16 n=1 Tax=Pseudocercospora fuligena TaxID=685502 RepID=A0A8H6RGS2_9PEZI|nr:Mediator of RNA polymerase II transcription subunit 16 [Pseudocercospora fuligena]